MVDGPGNELLAGSGFTGDQNGRVRTLGHFLDQIHHVGDGLAFGHKTWEVVPEAPLLQRLDLLAQGNGLQAVFYGHKQSFHLQGFDLVIPGPELHGGDDGVQILIRGDHDHYGFGVVFSDDPKGLDAGHAG